MYILGAAFFKEYDQLAEAHVVCDALHGVHVEHIRETGVADCENLLLYFFSHRRTSGKHPRYVELYIMRIMR